MPKQPDHRETGKAPTDDMNRVGLFLIKGNFYAISAECTRNCGIACVTPVHFLQLSAEEICNWVTIYRRRAVR